jgi:hypothetical protein
VTRVEGGGAHPGGNTQMRVTALVESGDISAGVPAGGTTGQVLAKTSGTDYHTQWIDPPAGPSGLQATVWLGS